MADNPGEGIYRAMAEDGDGMPKLGPAALKLGIRRGKDIVPDAAGWVHRPGFRHDEPNGLSCAPTILELPRFSLPVEWGGTNRKTSVWQIAASDLGSDLVAGQDTAPGATYRHISVGPSRTMPYDDYERAIEVTRARWRKITNP